MSIVKTLAGVHLTGPTISVHSNDAYVVNKPARYVAIQLL